MNDTPLHVVGNVVDVPRQNRTSNGSVTNFRMASTSRRWDEETKGFIDGATLWIDVACWNELGGNVARSVTKGDPVVVVGNLLTESWESETGRRSANRIKAIAVGLNLARGWSDFTRPPRVDRSAGLASPQEPGEDASSTEDPYAHRPTDYTGGSETLHSTDSEVTSEEPAVPALT
ncbi:MULTISPECIES: single-stranded DNA-binding protein [unclassified Modestobacter]|uniref:single-stranded DNA-binding protein n=1 Tax=unclassified Modestobacter TaxID=2643866 RepID=UPI0022AB4327|nr:MULTISPECIES: single-stranded DNA-binding protein [unclassified Modestobacter]MCZ2824478.1 single-stranded DNA-binding protein [Modestobacter sp. VKM Ac-2981]MCZ2853994.1 single-stranded DNA-binding protein [Modestobacter sp. VKM Ac-2982]